MVILMAIYGHRISCDGHNEIMMAINGYDFFLASSGQTKMREMPKQLNLMPPHTNNVKTTPDVVPLIAARAVH